jgi:hypothetical protein
MSDDFHITIEVLDSPELSYVEINGDTVDAYETHPAFAGKHARFILKSKIIITEELGAREVT